jgi:hypothetical protein
MSYRIGKNDLATPYINPKHKSSANNNPHIKQNLTRKVSTSYKRPRPMSYTFHHPIVENDKNNKIQDTTYYTHYN